MKIVNRRQLWTVSAATALLLGSTISPVFGEDVSWQDGIDQTYNQTALNSQTINIDGQFAEAAAPEAPSAEEIRDNAVNEAEINNARAVAKKIKTYRIPKKQVNEIRDREGEKIQKRLAEVFGGGTTSTSTAKTTAVVAAPAPVSAPAPTFANQVKILPTVGIANIQGDGFDLESNFLGGISAEATVHPHITVGIGFNYSKMEITDIGSNYNGNYNTGYNYNNWYTNQFGAGRTINYRQMGLEISSKFFPVENSRVRPYLGAVVGYNRLNMDYEDGGAYYNNYNQTAYGEEEYSTSYISGGVLLGSEMSITSNVGINLEARYTMGLTSAYVGDSTSYVKNGDQDRLNRLGTAIEDASSLTINGGVIISF
jgi:outer membrane protein W